MFHLSTRSIAEEHIFRDAADYAAGLTIVAGVVAQGLMVCHLLCLMPTHYHVLATFPGGALTDAAHKLNRRYAVRFNRRWNRHGRVFDGPFSAKEVATEAHFLEAVRYIANNPPEPETWPYSSYPALLGLRPPWSFVDPAPILEAFPDPAALRAFVNERRAA